MTDHPVTRSEVVVRVANRVHQARIMHGFGHECAGPDRVDFAEAELIVDDVLNWREPERC